MEQERLINEAQESLRVSPDTAARYSQAKNVLIDEVNARTPLSTKPKNRDETGLS
jgi:hypothetical protein